MNGFRRKIEERKERIMFIDIIVDRRATSTLAAHSRIFSFSARNIWMSSHPFPRRCGGEEAEACYILLSSR
jgi:hypothetical protein